MSDHTDLSAILGDPQAMPARQPETEPVEPVDDEPVAEAPEAPAEPVKEAPAPAPKAEPQMVPLAALQEAREKARELERRLQASQPKVEPPRAPDIFANPDEFTAFMSEQSRAIALEAKLDISEAMAREAFGDERVDEAFAAFQDRTGQDPSLYQRTLAQKSPWHAVVKWHEAEKVRAEMGDDPVAYRAKVEAEVRAKIAAEQRKPIPAAPSLATQPNLGSRPAPQWAGPTPLDRILGR